MIANETCRVCHGTGTLDYEEEKWFDGSWRRRTGGAEPLWPKIVEACPNEARYEEGPCEVCDGKGEYQIEVFRGVKIY